MEHLVIRLHEDGAPVAAHWVVLDDDGRIVRRAASGALSEAAEGAGGRRVVVLVPGLEVVSTEAVLPKTSPARLRKMLPYSLEDTLAEDVEKLFFAVGPRLESGGVSVAVVSRSRLETWLGMLAESGLSPHAVFSDADGVPDTPSALTLVVEDQRIYGRVAGRPPFVLDELPLDRVLEVVDVGAELRHAVVYVDEAAEGRYRDGLGVLAERVPSAQVRLMTDGALYRFASTLASRPGTNLLQGPYARKSSVGALLKPWRAAAALLLAAVLLMFVVQAAELIALRRQDASLTELLTDACRREFSTPRLDACEAAVRARLGESGLLEADHDGFLSALAAVAESRGADSRIAALSYRNRVMDLQLQVPDVPALDALARSIEQSARFEVRIQSANPGNGEVEGRVQLIGASR